MKVSEYRQVMVTRRNLYLCPLAQLCAT